MLLLSARSFKPMDCIDYMSCDKSYFPLPYSFRFCCHSSHHAEQVVTSPRFLHISIYFVIGRKAGKASSGNDINTAHTAREVSLSEPEKQHMN